MREKQGVALNVMVHFPDSTELSSMTKSNDKICDKMGWMQNRRHYHVSSARTMGKQQLHAIPLVVGC